MTPYEKDWIKMNCSFGETQLEDDGPMIPYVAVPNMPDGRKFTIDEIIEVLNEGRKRRERGNK